MGMAESKVDTIQNKTKEEAQPKSGGKWLLENILSLGLALFLVFMVRSSVVEAFKIPSGSMIPTLYIGDHIFVNKFAYGFKLPFSDTLTDKPYYLVDREGPKRGDIIVFEFPRDRSIYYIKRVIGIPGDSIEIRNKLLYINNEAVSREPLTEDQAKEIFTDLEDPKYSHVNLEVFREKVNGDGYTVMMDKNSFLNENFGPISVPQNSFFVMGDNRDFSNDSRFWGFVPMDNVKGKAMVIWLSIWLDFKHSQYDFRPDRIGTVLQ